MYRLAWLLTLIVLVPLGCRARQIPVPPRPIPIRHGPPNIIAGHSVHIVDPTSRNDIRVVTLSREQLVLESLNSLLHQEGDILHVFFDDENGGQIRIYLVTDDRRFLATPVDRADYQAQYDHLFGKLPPGSPGPGGRACSH